MAELADALDNSSIHFFNTYRQSRRTLFHVDWQTETRISEIHCYNISYYLQLMSILTLYDSVI